MPIILDNKDGPNLGPGQSYGYQGQYQGQRQPGIDQANMGGPQYANPITDILPNLSLIHISEPTRPY